MTVCQSVLIDEELVIFEPDRENEDTTYKFSAATGYTQTIEGEKIFEIKKIPRQYMGAVG